MSSVREWKACLALFVMCFAAIVAAPAQTFTTLDTGVSSSGPLVQGIDGNLYGSGSVGASEAIFRMTPEGTISTLYTFEGLDGRYPTGLVLETNGNLYGTTERGGAASPTCSQSQGCGTVFGFTSAGVRFTLHSFNGVDGINPKGGLTLGPDGSTLYGTTSGNTAKGASGALYGTVFKITPNGSFTLLHAFDKSDGAYPVGPLVLGSNGNLYGTTTSYGADLGGTVFEITPVGTFTILHNFNPITDGTGPMGALVLAGDGNFYGTTLQGGAHGDGTVFYVSPGGRVFQALYNFTGGSDAGFPYAGLVLGADGNFYGAASGFTLAGGATLFEINPKGVLTNLHDFGIDSSVVGQPTLMQATSGTFYGSADQRMSGTTTPVVFSLSTGLGPFITAVPGLRGIGTKVLILGQGLTGATSVTFNGVSAEFTVNSDTEITTTVPAGATKGYIQITTPTGTLSTKVVFFVG